MINDQQRRKAAQALLNAGDRRLPVRQVSQTWPATQIEDAYAIQQIWADSRAARGARVVGHKIGLTSRATQMASEMTEPDYGVLLDDMLYADGARIRASQVHAPRLEVELAFVHGKPISGKLVTLYDVLDATRYVTPALKIIDYRTEVPRTICDTGAHRAAAAVMITGGRVVRPMDVDPRWVGATLSKNGVIQESGVSTAVMGHPGMGIVWLSRRLSQHDICVARSPAHPADRFLHATHCRRGRRHDPRRLRPAWLDRSVVKLMIRRNWKSSA